LSRLTRGRDTHYIHSRAIIFNTITS